MTQLKEIRLNGNHIQLQDNLVRSSILPEKINELNRSITAQGNVLIEGAVYATKFEITEGPLEVQGAVFTQNELYASGSVQGSLLFQKSVASAGSIILRTPHAETTFRADINATEVVLTGAFVAGSIYADSITLENCVVLGGLFATKELVLTNCIVGTFNSPYAEVHGSVGLLFPSAFTLEALRATKDSLLYSLTLADLGHLYRGLPQDPQSGRIEMNVEADLIESNLVSEEKRLRLRSYSVAGKVLATELADTDKFQNHFLITAASLGPQLLKVYDLGTDKDGNPALLEPERLRSFFMNLLHHPEQVQPLDARVGLSDLIQQLS